RAAARLRAGGAGGGWWGGRRGGGQPPFRPARIRSVGGGPFRWVGHARGGLAAPPRARTPPPGAPRGWGRPPRPGPPPLAGPRARPGSTSRSETPGVGADRRPVGETPEKQWRTPARAISARLVPTRAEEHPPMRLAARSAHIVAAALALACGVPWMLAPRTADASPPPSMRSHPVPSASSPAPPGPPAQRPRR